MANQTITQLPDAGPITGTELVPIVQNGGTVKTTAAALAGSPVQTQTFLTLNQEPTLNNSRYLSAGTGVGLTDGGAQSFYRISLNGASGSLETMGDGFAVKIGGTMTPRLITYSGPGIDVTNGDGQSGNPTIALNGTVASLAGNGGTGFLALPGNGTVSGRTLTGTTDQIDVTNPNGISGSPIFSIADNAVFPGVGGVTLPNGTDAERPGTPYSGQIRYNTTSSRFEGYTSSWQQFGSGDGTVTNVIGTANEITVVNGTTTPTVGLADNPVLPGIASTKIPSGGTADRPVPAVDGMIRYNTDLALFEGYVNGAWTVFSSGAGVTSITTGTGLTGGPITSTGTISIANTAVTAGAYGGASKTLSATVNAQGQLTALSETNIAISNSQVSGLGTMSTQDANNVAITGGSVNGALIGNTTPSAGTFTSATMTTGSISTAPANANDIVNKSYVDTLFSTGVHFHQPVRVESPINLNATYNNGASGVGATLTNAGTQVALVIDGVTLSVNDRVLVYQQSNQTQNGIYVVSNVGSGSTNWVLTRSSDANTYIISSANGLSEGSTVFVQQGTTGAGETYTCNTSGVITFGTTNITFAQISAGQIYSAGTGLTLAGTQFSITNTSVTAGSYGSASDVGTFSVNAQGQLTTAATVPIAISGSQITSGVVATANGGTGLSSFTASGVVYASSTSALTTGSALTFDGLNFTLGNGSAQNTIYLNGSATTGAAIVGQRNGSNAWFVGDTYAALGSGTGYITYVYGNEPTIWYNNGAEQMRLTSTGLGIGTSSPLLTAAGRGNVTINGSSDSIVAFGNNGSTSAYIYSSSAKLEFDAAGTRWIQWNTNGSEQMRLNSTGLGIGTSSPDGRLHVNSIGTYTTPTEAKQIALGESSGNNNFRLQLGYMLSNSTTWQGSIQSFTAGSPGNLILNGDGGNVGIGTSSPTAKLHVVGSKAIFQAAGPSQGAIQFGTTDTTHYIAAGNDYLGMEINSTGVGNEGIKFFTGTSGSGSERMRLDATGNLGVGTSSPGYKLTVAGTGGSATVSLLETGVRSWGIRAGGAASNTFDVADFTAGATRLTIDSSGNVGIGTASPTSKLDVNGTITATQYTGINGGTF